MKDIRARWGVVAFGGACLALGFWYAAARDIVAPSPPAKPSALMVSVRDGLFSIAAKAAAWGKVLDGLWQKTGIHLISPYRWKEPLPARSLPSSQRCDAVWSRSQLPLESRVKVYCNGR